ncbi:hypothetical protein H0W26_02990, partial [Candidatus Dependentiae bacterium]|nr:hypothetical protein [Candidatus Dependentiae bacterium]
MYRRTMMKKLKLQIFLFGLMSIVSTLPLVAAQRELYEEESMRQRLQNQANYGYQDPVNLQTIDPSRLRAYAERIEKFNNPPKYLQSPPPVKLHTHQPSDNPQNYRAFTRTLEFLNLSEREGQPLGIEIYDQYGGTCSIYALCS